MNRRIKQDQQRHSPKRDYIEYTIALNNSNKMTSNKFIAENNPKSVKINAHSKEVQGTEITSVSPQRFNQDMKGSQYNHVKEVQVMPKLLEKRIASNEKF